MPEDAPGPARRLGEKLAANEPAASIGWECRGCGDEGTISNWARIALRLAAAHVDAGRRAPGGRALRQAAAALRELQMFDPDSERIVFAMRGDAEQAVLAATDAEIDELIGYVAAEANHETNRARQRRLDDALRELRCAGGC